MFYDIFIKQNKIFVNNIKHYFVSEIKTLKIKENLKK